MGTVGSRPGHKGRKTTYYSPDVLEAALRIKILKAEHVPGEDYIVAADVPAMMCQELEPPTFGLKDFGPLSWSEHCCIGPQVAELNQLGFNQKQSTSRPMRGKAQIVPSNSEDGDGAGEGSGIHEAAEEAGEGTGIHEAAKEVSGEESDELGLELSG